ncbi:hypothetical protein [Tsukamurella paurometabola]|uniref:Excreted virulence factor EspC, type VII ESX diderm n=1 Tax=Tsukamurella paurometabola TaxID=2061 RepID=A0A3P8L301_TSUPA|nr:hypothetical protein [Tsukamurella paurometabola]MBS4103881.1 hypothetical protein [Tsukamurella paurometabola]UEA82357.1 hypothetical protein LK411_18580 [Tsukamurella paurometabola]VDR39405.1 Uncharacterised protein [Tsukamurella paurometabola]
MGTKIDAAAVSAAGGTYSTVADNLGTVAGRIRGFTAEAGDFGRKYQADGAAYAATMESLAKGIDAWQAGSRACGTGLTTSASAHKTTDDSGAAAVTGA